MYTQSLTGGYMPNTLTIQLFKTVSPCLICLQLLEQKAGLLECITLGKHGRELTTCCASIGKVVSEETVGALWRQFMH